MNKYLKSSSLFPFLQIKTTCAMQVTFAKIVRYIHCVFKETTSFNILWSNLLHLNALSDFPVPSHWTKDIMKEEMKYDLWTAN